MIIGLTILFKHQGDKKEGIVLDKFRTGSPSYSTFNHDQYLVVDIRDSICYTIEPEDIEQIKSPL